MMLFRYSNFSLAFLSSLSINTPKCTKIISTRLHNLTNLLHKGNEFRKLVNKNKTSTPKAVHGQVNIEYNYSKYENLILCIVKYFLQQVTNMQKRQCV